MPDVAPTLKRCTRCILSERTRGIAFDEDGVCSFCTREIPPDLPLLGEQTDRTNAIAAAVRAFVDQHGTKGDYDCLVLLSGGKDSLMALWLVPQVYGFRTLAATLDNGFWDEAVIANARRGAEAAGADWRLISAECPRQIFARFLESEQRTRVSVCALCNQVRTRFFSAAFALAAQEQIPLIVDGRSKIDGEIERWPGLAHQLKLAQEFLRSPALRGIVTPEHTGAVEGVDWSGGWFSPWLHMRRDIDATVRFLETRCGWIEPARSWPRRSSNCRLSLLDGHLCHRYGIPDNPCEHELSMEIRHGETRRADALEYFLSPVNEAALRETLDVLGVRFEAL